MSFGSLGSTTCMSEVIFKFIGFGMAVCLISLVSHN